MEQAVLELRHIGDIQGQFFVARYQRGYRWGPDEVRRLLDDLWENREQNYSLQPVVVKRRGEEWELVDGQQRMTTLYLLLRYMEQQGLQNVGPMYELRYARPARAARPTCATRKAVRTKRTSTSSTSTAPGSASETGLSS